MLTIEELAGAVEDGSIDTVVVAFTDMQGRLVGKRLHGEYFVEERVWEHGVEGCDYLLALDMEMDPVPGYAIANWERGYGDFALRPELPPCGGSRGSRRTPTSRMRHASRTASAPRSRRSRAAQWSERPSATT